MITGAQNDFINNVASVALQDAPLYGIHVVSPIIAQAIIESNWGKSGLATKGLNLFGIKCGKNWTGAAINMQTKEEFTPGQLTSVSAFFRKYDSWDDSIHDYFKFINTKRYEKLKDCYDPQSYCEAIKAAGYATSSSYVSTLMNCIHTYNLTDFDKYLDVETHDLGNGYYEVTSKEEVTAVIDYSKVVNDVINGLYGNGEDRVVNLANNGYNPLAVQYMVNQQIKINTLTNDLEKAYNKLNKLKEVLSQ